MIKVYTALSQAGAWEQEPKPNLTMESMKLAAPEIFAYSMPSMVNTAFTLNEVNPDKCRLRRCEVYPACPVYLLPIHWGETFFCLTGQI